MHLLEQKDLLSAHSIILEAFEEAAKETSSIVTINRMLFHLEEVLFRTMRDEIEEFFDNYGIQLDIESFDDINRSMIEDSGVKPPSLTKADVVSIFRKENICYIDSSGNIVNNPQYMCLEGVDRFIRRNIPLMTM